MLITIALAVTKISDVMAPSQKPVTSRPRAPSKPHPVTKSIPSMYINRSCSFTHTLLVKRLTTFNSEQIIKLSLEVDLKSISLELTKSDHALLRGVTSGTLASPRLFFLNYY